MVRAFVVAVLLSGFSAWAGCTESCDQIPDACTKACQKKGAGGNSGMCKSKCDEATKKCKDNCAKKGK